ncbi:MAG: hypothetical protein JWR03_463 [Cohnella sp.]|nr:hypothetical protein [Cohnella sp.]
MWITRIKSKRTPIHSVHELCIGVFVIQVKFLIFSVRLLIIL